MPAYRTAAVVWSKAFVDKVLSAIKTNPAAALVVAGKVRLSKDPAYNPAPGDAIADLTPQEADFTGYPAGGVALALSGPVNLGGAGDAMIADALFTGGGPFLVDNGIRGYWIDDGAIVVCGERFADGLVIGIAAAGDFIELDLRLPLGFFESAAG